MRTTVTPDEPTSNDEPPFEIPARPLELREGIDPARLCDLEDPFEIAEFRRKTRALREEISE